MPLRLDLGDGVVVADFVRASLRPGAQFGDHVEHFDVGDQLFERHGQPALDPACRVDHNGRPSHQAAPEPHLVLVRRLHVIEVGGRARRRPPRQPDMARQLPCRQRCLKVRGRPKGGGAGLDIDVRGEGAVAHRRAGSGQLGQHDRGQRLGVAERDRPRHGDRCHGPHQGKGGDDRHLAVAGEVDQPLCHGNIQRPGRVGIDDGVAVRTGAKVIVADPAKIPDHLETVHDLRRAAGEDEWKLVGQRHLRVGREVVAQVVVHVLRLDLRRDHLQHVEVLGQLEVLNIVAGRACAPAPLQIGGVGRTGPGLKHQ